MNYSMTGPLDPLGSGFIVRLHFKRDENTESGSLQSLSATKSIRHTIIIILKIFNKPPFVAIKSRLSHPR